MKIIAILIIIVASVVITNIRKAKNDKSHFINIV